MADRPHPHHPHQLQVHPQHPYEGGPKNLLSQKGGPSASKIIAVVTLLPVGGTLLALAGITFAGTTVGLLVTTPLFILFSPILVPAAIVIGLAVTAFLASGALGITALSSLSWVFNYFRQGRGQFPETLEQAKRRMQETAGHVGQKTKEMEQKVQGKVQEGGRT